MPKVIIAIADSICTTDNNHWAGSTGFEVNNALIGHISVANAGVI